MVAAKTVERAWVCLRISRDLKRKLRIAAFQRRVSPYGLLNDILRKRLDDVKEVKTPAYSTGRTSYCVEMDSDIYAKLKEKAIQMDTTMAALVEQILEMVLGE